MNILILYIGESVRFDQDEVRRALQSVPGTHSFREGTVGTVFECQYDFDLDKTIVRLLEDHQSISIAGSGDASLKIAVELQARVSSPLRLVDSDYSFDIPLSEATSIEQIRSRMVSSSG